MNPINLLFIMLFMIFIIDKITRNTALTVLAGYLLYYLFIVGLKGAYFYAGLAAIELLAFSFIIIMSSMSIKLYMLVFKFSYII